MTKVLAGVTMSLDGYVHHRAERGARRRAREGGERLHYWVFGSPWTYGSERGEPAAVDQEYMDEVFSSGGAWIVGRTMHDVVDGWGDDPGLGVPVFVVTHRPHETVVKGDTSFEFVTGGIDDALSRAPAAAQGNNVIVMWGADPSSSRDVDAGPPARVRGPRTIAHVFAAREFAQLVAEFWI